MAWRLPTLRVLLSLCLLLSLSAAASAGKKKPPAKPVNINTANAEELQQVPGIGPATAQKILQMRKSYGAFKRVDDLLAIRGLGQKRLDKMRKYLTVGKPALSGNPGSASKPASPPNTSSTSMPPFRPGISYDQMLHQSA
jgi:comEA protein